MEKYPEYIIERVISNQRQEICYNGILCVQGLDDCLMRPLALKRVEVVSIEPLHASKTDCGFCGFSQREHVQLSLICWVRDACGRVSRGVAQLTVEVCAAMHAGNVRRGATLTMKQACFQRESMFDIKAVIDMHTIVSRSELLMSAKCENKCPPAWHEACMHRRSQGKR